MPPKNYKK